jgi:hypothetical protein
VLVGPGRERRRDRRRRRHRRGHPHREPQPPLLHRALPGCGHRGIGGILRDIFTMGARPIALMDPLRFGPLDDPRSRWIAEGVVSGISGYGNSVGVPTVGRRGGLRRDLPGQPPRQRALPGPAAGGPAGARPGVGRRQPGRAARVDHRSRRHRRRVGARLGRLRRRRDRGQAPRVQVGDPFEEKRLIEACLELLDAGLVVGIQDLGGAGLTCAASETASPSGGVGMDVDVAAVPARGRHGALRGHDLGVPGADARHRRRPRASTRCCDLCERWEVRPRWSARSPSTGRRGRLRIVDGFDGEVLADRAGQVAARRRAALRPAPPPNRPTSTPAGRFANALPAPDLGADLLDLLCDTTWVSSQYDHQLFLNTVEGPAATPWCCASSTPPPAPTPAGAWPSPPTATTAGARSIPGVARRSPSPSR